MGDIVLFNTDGRKKEVFMPRKSGEVTMYSCGPTVYHYAHIGNMRSYVFADTLKRMFLFNNLRVHHIINITDVGHLTSDADDGEDRMLKGARREGKTTAQIAEYYTKAFVADFQALRNLAPDKFVKATEHIAEMIAMIRLLEHKGCTYVAQGNVYLDTTQVAEYGRLFNLAVDEQMKSRVGVDTAKRNPRDFVLWFTKSKFQDQEMKWPSPWGEGYPGWHIECSAMATKHLGEHIDVHTGGIDHIPVHHTNEIAQSECALGHRWVNVWMHNEFLLLDEGKMAKSADNFLRLQTLLDNGYTPEDYRYLLLQTHYRKSINFSWDALSQAKRALEKIKQRVLDVIEEKKKVRTPVDATQFSLYEERFRDAINDDLNTPQALAVFWDVLQDNVLDAHTRYDILLRCDLVLGLGLYDVQPVRIPDEVAELVRRREEARKNKDWQHSDKLREEIHAKGYAIKDTPDGPLLRAI